MSSPDLQVAGLRVAARRRTILEVDRLTVARGEIVGLLGPNGAGKTTLIRVALGLQRPTTGQITLLGRRVDHAGAFALTRLRRRVGYVPQELAGHSLLPLTLREVVAIGRSGIRGLALGLRRDDWRIIDGWIERLGLGGLRAQPYGQLSGGERRKALIAMAMAQEPRLLFLDEPTANLDLGWREQIVATLETLSREVRPTLLLVCHELEVLPPSCRRCVLLDGGRVVADGPPEAVLTPERVAGLYGPRLTVRHVGGRHVVIPSAEVAS